MGPKIEEEGRRFSEKCSRRKRKRRELKCEDSTLPCWHLRWKGSLSKAMYAASTSCYATSQQGKKDSYICMEENSGKNLNVSQNSSLQLPEMNRNLQSLWFLSLWDRGRETTKTHQIYDLKKLWDGTFALS